MCIPSNGCHLLADLLAPVPVNQTVKPGNRSRFIGQAQFEKPPYPANQVMQRFIGHGHLPGAFPIDNRGELPGVRDVIGSTAGNPADRTHRRSSKLTRPLPPLTCQTLPSPPAAYLVTGPCTAHCLLPRGLTSIEP